VELKRGYIINTHNKIYPSFEKRGARGELKNGGIYYANAEIVELYEGICYYISRRIFFREVY